MVVVLALCVVPALLAAPAKALHPPKTGRIVEGVSAGGVSIGDTYADVVALWGKPDNVYCQPRNDGKGLGRVYRNGVSECSWYMAPHDTLGTLQVSLAPLTSAGAMTNARVALMRVEDLKDQPGFRWKPVFTGWRTASGIGLRSTVAAVQKAYGARLHTVPHSKTPPTYSYSALTYVVTRSGGKRWVTIFSLSPFGGSGGPLRVQLIEIEEYSLLAPTIKQAAQVYGPADVPLK